MKTVISINAVEVSAINDLLGTYGSEYRIKQIGMVTHGISMSGVFINNGNKRTYVLTIEIPMVLGLIQIAMNHANAVKGLVKALSGIRDTIEYLGRNISRDIRNLMKEYEEKK